LPWILATTNAHRRTGNASRKKFGRFAFEGVADELEDPSDDKQSQRVEPQAMNKDAGEKKWD